MSDHVRDGIASYERGDLEEAMRCFERAHEAGDRDGTCYLAWMMLGTGDPAQRPAAIALYEQAAEAGHARSQYELSRMLAFGDGLPADIDRAMALVRSAAESGFFLAQEELGKWLEHSWGTDEDQVEAARWYRAAAEQGHLPAMERLAELHDEAGGCPDLEQSARWWERARQAREQRAEAGDVESAEALAFAFHGGEPLVGGRADPVQAARWAERAFEGGGELCAVLYARLLWHGIGLDADPDRARAILEAEAEAGSVEAAYWLANPDGTEAEARAALLAAIRVNAG